MMDGFTPVTPVAAPAGLSVAALDRELLQVETDLAVTDSPEVAGVLAARQLALEAARRVAGAREAAQHRRQQVEQAEAARVAAAALETEVEAALLAQARDLDEWLERGATLVRAFRNTDSRLHAFSGLLPKTGIWHRDLAVQRRREDLFAIEDVLERRLAAGQVLVTTPPGGGDFASVTTYVAHRWRQFMAAVRERLPAATAAVPTLEDQDHA